MIYSYYFLALFLNSDLFDKIKQDSVSTTVWTHQMDADGKYGKKLDRNYIRILHVLVSESRIYLPTKQQLYDHIPPISQAVQGKRTWHAGHCCRSKEKLIRNVLSCSPAHGWIRTCLYQLCADTGCILEDLPGPMNDRDKWIERERERERERENQRHLMMMMMMMLIYINIYIYI